MAAGEKAITCAASIGAGCATLADAAITGGILTIFAGATGAASLFSDQASKSSIESELTKIRKEIYGSLSRYTTENETTPATIDAIYIRLDSSFQDCIPTDTELVEAGVAPSEIGKLILEKLSQIDGRFETDKIWREIARRIFEGAFERAFARQDFLLSLAPKITQQTLQDLTIIKDGVAELRLENAEGMEKILARLESIEHTSGDARPLGDPAQLQKQIRTLYRSNDVEAQKALERGVPGDGIDDLDALNRQRVNHIRDMESGLAIEKLAAARSCRAAGAAHFFLGQVGKALENYEAARELEPNDFWTLVYLTRIYHLSARTAEALTFANLSANAALTEREHSVALNEIGDIQVARGDLTAALTAYGEGLVIARHLAEDETNAGAQRDLSVSLNKIGDIQIARGDLAAALTAYEGSLAISRRLAENETNAGAQRDLSVSLNKVGDIQVARGALAAALTAYEEGLSIRRRLAEDETNAGAQRDLSVSLNNIGNIQIARGDLAAALTFYQEGLAILRRLAEDQTNAGAKRDLSVSLNKIGDVQVARGDLAAALAFYQEGLVIARRLAEDQTNAGAKRDLSVSLDRVGAIQRARGDLTTTLTAYEESLTIRRHLAEDETNAGARRDLSVSLNNIGDIQIARGDLAAALTFYEEGLVIARRLAENETNAGAQRDLSVSLERTGDTYEKLDDIEAAIRQYEESLPVAERLAALDQTHTQWAYDLKITRRRLAALKAKR